MAEFQEQRRYPRMSTPGRDYAVRFQLKGRVVEDARLANLSACGCGLEVQMAEARDLDVGTILESFYLDHPELPYVPFQACVVRVLGKVPGKTQGYALVGVEFPRITTFVKELIQAHVAASMAEVEA